jgi:hypothetical protein
MEADRIPQSDFLKKQLDIFRRFGIPVPDCSLPREEWGWMERRLAEKADKEPYHWNGS